MTHSLNRFSSTLLCCFVGLCLGCCVVMAGPLKTEVLDHVVHIEAGKMLGSGITIKHNNHILVLTAAHVVSKLMEPSSENFTDAAGKVQIHTNTKPKACKLKWRSGKESTGNVVWYGTDWLKDGTDLALIKPDDDKGLSGVELLKEGTEVEDGEDCWYCGSGGGIPFGLERSIISRQDARYLETNGCSWYGHSGSGLFVKRDKKFLLAAVLNRFAQLPNDNIRTPIKGERLLHQFLATYKPEEVTP